MMYHIERVAGLFILAVACLALVQAASNNDENEYAKDKRANLLRFMPFPRTGRSDPEMMAQNQPQWDGNSVDSSLEDYDSEIAQYMESRHPYLPFGRQSQTGSISGRLMNAAKRAGVTAGANGMWFGPRLGRVHKRDPQQQQQGDH